jgi:hypothetical protein
MSSRSSVVFLLAVAITVTATAAPATEMAFPAGPGREQIELRSQAGTTVISVLDDRYEQLRDTGRPILPYRLIQVLLPDGEAVENYRFVFSGETVVADGIVPEVAPPFVSTENRVVENPGLAEWRENSGVFPASAGRYLGTSYLHGFSIANFVVFPLALADGVLVLREEMRLEVTTGPSADDPGIVKRERYRAGFREKVRSYLPGAIVNPDMASGLIPAMSSVGRSRAGSSPVRSRPWKEVPSTT